MFLHMNEASNLSDRSLDLGMGQIIDGIPAWVQVCDLEGRIQSVNLAAIEISGYDRAEMVGQDWPYPWFGGQGSAIRLEQSRRRPDDPVDDRQGK